MPYMRNVFRELKPRSAYISTIYRDESKFHEYAAPYRGHRYYYTSRNSRSSYSMVSDLGFAGTLRPWNIYAYS